MQPNNALQPTPPPPLPRGFRLALQAVSRLSLGVRPRHRAEWVNCAMSKMQLSGWLTDYSAQGMEGGVEWAFMNAAYADADGWDERGIIFFEGGDQITLFNPDGTLLWAGVIEKVHGELGEVFDSQGHLVSLKLIFPHRDRLPFSTWIPNGVAVQDWLKWCYQKPPLRASLERQ